MTSIDQNDSRRLARLESDYARILRNVISEIFNTDPEGAESYLHELADCTPYERLLALHESPIVLASLLTGIEINDEMQSQYEIMLNETHPRSLLIGVAERPSALAFSQNVDVFKDIVPSKYVPLTLVEQYLVSSGYRKADTGPGLITSWELTDESSLGFRTHRVSIPKPSRPASQSRQPALSRKFVIELIMHIYAKSKREAELELARLEGNPPPTKPIR